MIFATQEIWRGGGILEITFWHKTWILRKIVTLNLGRWRARWQQIIQIVQIWWVTLARVLIFAIWGARSTSLRHQFRICDFFNIVIFKIFSVFLWRNFWAMRAGGVDDARAFFFPVRIILPKYSSSILSYRLLDKSTINLVFLGSTLKSRVVVGGKFFSEIKSELFWFSQKSFLVTWRDLRGEEDKELLARLRGEL